MPYRILNIEPSGYALEAKAILSNQAELIELERFSRAELLELLPTVDVLITRLAYRIDREILEASSRLRAVATATTGLNHIDVEAATSLGISVLSLRGETEFLRSVTATAELTWALLLALIRRIPEACADVQKGSWNRDQFKGLDLSGRTLGILGYGRLGRMVASYGVVFGMTVLAHDPRVRTVGEGVRWVKAEELYSGCDILSIHVDLNCETESLVGARELSLMKDWSFLINTSRGEILDESSLVEALRSGKLAGAALDVLRGEASGDLEWEVKSPAWNYLRSPNQQGRLLITPHIGGATSDSLAKTEVFIARKIAKFLSRILSDT